MQRRPSPLLARPIVGFGMRFPSFFNDPRFRELSSLHSVMEDLLLQECMLLRIASKSFPLLVYPGALRFGLVKKLDRFLRDEGLFGVLGDAGISLEATDCFFTSSGERLMSLISSRRCGSRGIRSVRRVEVDILERSELLDCPGISLTITSLPRLLLLDLPTPRAGLSQRIGASFELPDAVGLGRCLPDFDFGKPRCGKLSFPELRDLAGARRRDVSSCSNFFSTQ